MSNERPLSPRPRAPKSRLFTTMSLILVFVFISLFTILIYATADKFSHDERIKNAKNQGKHQDSLDTTDWIKGPVGTWISSSLIFQTPPTGLKDMKKKGNKQNEKSNIIPKSKFSIETTIEFKNKWGKPQKLIIPLDLAENESKKELYTNLVSDLKNTQQFVPFNELVNKMSSWKQMKNLKPNSKVTVTLKIDNCSDEEVVSTHIIKAKNKKLYIKQISETIFNEVDFFANNALAKIANEIPVPAVENNSEFGVYEYAYDQENVEEEEVDPNNKENEIVIDTDAVIDEIFNGADQVWKFFESDEEADNGEGKKKESEEESSSWW